MAAPPSFGAVQDRSICESDISVAESAVGASGGEGSSKGVLTATSALTRPYPKKSSGPGAPKSRAVFRRCSLISALVIPGLLAFIRAATPETCGAANDVPAPQVYVKSTEFPFGTTPVDTIYVAPEVLQLPEVPPGAASSIVSPNWLYDVNVSSCAVAETEITLR